MQCKHHIPVKWLVLHPHSAYIYSHHGGWYQKNYTTIISNLLAISKLHPNPPHCSLYPIKIQKIFSGNQPWLQDPPFDDFPSYKTPFWGISSHIWHQYPGIPVIYIYIYTYTYIYIYIYIHIYIYIYIYIPSESNTFFFLGTKKT